MEAFQAQNELSITVYLQEKKIFSLCQPVSNMKEKVPTSMLYLVLNKWLQIVIGNTWEMMLFSD